MPNDVNVHCAKDVHCGAVCSGSIQEKVEMLRSLENPCFDYSLIPRYLDYASDFFMAKPILKKIVKKLVEVDAHICAFHDVLSEEEWEDVCADHVPEDANGQDVELKTKLSILNQNFMSVYENLRRLGIEAALDILSPIFKIRTRNVQFLLFMLAKDFPNQVLGFLISRLKRDPKTFAPFFSSLLVRLDFCAELKQKCAQALCKHFGTLRPSSAAEYVVLSQSILYILCFREFSLDGAMPVRRLFEEETVSLMNRNVVAKFCEIHGEKIPIMHSLKNECLYLFPFDFPISKPIASLVEEYFVSFK